jgi:hypothetical protein
MRYVTTRGLLFVILVSPAASQPPTLAEQPLVIEGRVLWIDFGSQTLMLAPATGSQAIAIDLHRNRQSDYHGFRGNEYVQVGYVLRPSRRIQAFQTRSPLNAGAPDRMDFRLPWLANARGSLGQLLPILAAKLQRGSVRISAAISWPRVTTARAIAATIGS